MSLRHLTFALAATALLAAASAAFAQNFMTGSGPVGATLLPQSPGREVGFDQKMGARLPLDATFKDEAGRDVRLADYLGKKPVVLSLAYYECPMLCGMALEGLARSLKGFDLVPGKDFEVVTLSFNPAEKPDLARGKKTNLVQFYGKPGGEEGWHFLTGDEAQIRRVTETVGFKYRWDEKQKQYAHATGVVLLTPEGVVSRYFFGIEYAPKELRLGLSEASSGKVGGLTAQLLLLCYQYDPSVGKYTASTLKVLKVAAAATMLALGGFIAVMLRRERVRARRPVGVNA